MDTDALNRRAYPAEWSIADVLSHLGSGAVITNRRLQDALAGVTAPDDFAPSVWDAWNAKTPDGQRSDALVADAELLERIDAITPQERASFTSEMGPMTLDFEQFVGMRLNEHVLHTWDIESTGDTRIITITTTEPDRGFAIELSPDAATVTPTSPDAHADLVVPAEAFVRLVYGRLDPEHTPGGSEGDDVAILRRVFPGP